MLSGAMMLRYLGWDEAPSSSSGASSRREGRQVTYDLARQMQGTAELKTSAFADVVISHK